MTENYDNEISTALQLISEQFKEALREKEWTASNVAAKIGMVYNTVKSVINGNPANITTYMKVAHALDCDIFDHLQPVVESSQTEQVEEVSSDTAESTFPFQEEDCEQEAESETEEDNTESPTESQFTI